MRHFKLTMAETHEGEWAMFRMWLTDTETGKRVPDEEVVKALCDLSATGIAVKSRLGIPEKYPLGGTITDITDTEVILDGKHQIPRSEFHQFYQLD